MWVRVIFCVASVSVAAQDLPPETVQLAHIRSHMVAQLGRQPDYTCLEIVERSRRGGGQKSFQRLDTVRLEVAMVDQQEMFGWPGAKKFESTDLREMVKSGAIGSGNFSSFASAIFEGNGAVFVYQGVEGEFVRYDYHVSLLNSGYSIRHGAHAATVAFHGSIYANPQTLDVQRIEVQAEDIPQELRLSATRTRMEYARVKIGDADFLLPAESEMTLTNLEGEQYRNSVRLTACRQFTGESMLTFDDVAAESAPKASPKPSVEEVTLPADLVLELKLTGEIDTKTAAVGDPVGALLTSDVKRKGQLLVAKGAKASGRITHLNKRADYTELGFEFDEVESGAAHAHFKGAIDSIPQGWFLATTGNQSFTAIRRMPSGETFVLVRSGVRIPRNTAFYWRTIE
jgi:hypothetical protein